MWQFERLAHRGLKDTTISRYSPLLQGWIPIDTVVWIPTTGVINLRRFHLTNLPSMEQGSDTERGVLSTVNAKRNGVMVSSIVITRSGEQSGRYPFLFTAFSPGLDPPISISYSTKTSHFFFRCVHMLILSAPFLERVFQPELRLRLFQLHCGTEQARRRL